MPPINPVILEEWRSLRDLIISADASYPDDYFFFNFDVDELESFSSQRYIDEIKRAARRSQQPSPPSTSALSMPGSMTTFAY